MATFANVHQEGQKVSQSDVNPDDLQQQNARKNAPLTPAELSRPTNIQRIQQKKSQVKTLPRSKKLEKLSVYSSCKVILKLLQHFL